MADPRDTSGGHFPTVEIGGRIHYLDYHNFPHPTQQQAIQANASIRGAIEPSPCQRGLDIPGFIPGPSSTGRGWGNR